MHYWKMAPPFTPLHRSPTAAACCSAEPKLAQGASPRVALGQLMLREIMG